MVSPQIVWLRRDLRLADQPAFHAAAAAGPVIPVYVLDDENAGDRRLGGASRWWLHGSLAALEQSLRRCGSRLVLRRGDVGEELGRIAKDTGATTVHALRHYEPWWRAAEQRIAKSLDLCLYDGNYLLPPGSVVTGAGEPYRIYTPFTRAAMRELPARDPLPGPALSRARGMAQVRCACRLAAAADQARLGRRSARRVGAGRGVGARPPRPVLR